MRIPKGLTVFLLGLYFAHKVAGAGTLADMRAKNSLSVCAHPDALPYSSNLPETPGFYIDVASLLAKNLDIPLEVNWVYTRANARLTDCDLYPGIAVLEDARQRASNGPVPPVLLSEPYMTQHLTLISRRPEAEVATLGGLRALQVAVPSGSWAHVQLVKAGIPVLVRFHDDQEIIGAVMNGLADAGIVSEAGLGWYQHNHPEARLTATEAPIAKFHLDFDIGVGLRQSDYSSLDSLNAVLVRMREDGTIKAILERYGIFYHPPVR